MLKRLYLGAVIVAAIVVVMVIILVSQLSQPRLNNSIFVDTGQSGCIAHLNQFNCTLVLYSSHSALKASQISAVTVNDTAAKIAVTPLPNGRLSVEADITITTVGRAGALNDISVVAPLSKGEAKVSFSDGTVFSTILDAQFVE
jgi:hypothetical protein